MSAAADGVVVADYSARPMLTGVARDEPSSRCLLGSELVCLAKPLPIRVRLVRRRMPGVGLAVRADQVGSAR
jgi:hypothetical protein